MKFVLTVMVCVAVLFTACPASETENTNQESPLPNIATQKQVAAGEEHTAVIEVNGTLYTWGKNEYGQLGTGDKKDRLIPTKVKNPPGVTSWKQVDAGWFYTMAISQDGILYGWGLNDNGQLGAGDMENKLIPTKAVITPGLTGWKSITAGYAHTLAISYDGTLYAWGRNYDGQLGNGKRGLHEKETTPTRVTNPNGVTAWKQVSAGGYHTMAIDADGTLYTWGQNRFKQLGTGDTENKFVPTKLVTPFGVKRWKQVSTGRLIRRR